MRFDNKPRLYFICTIFSVIAASSLYYYYTEYGLNLSFKTEGQTILLAIPLGIFGAMAYMVYKATVEI